LYGRKISNQQILEGDLKVSPAARPLIAELNRYRSAGEHREHADVAASLGEKGRVTLSNAHFEAGRAYLTPDSEAALHEAVAALKEHPDWRIRVEGFTDNQGSKEVKLKLSSDRADAVANWLADHGVDRDRLSSKGYGDARPVASNSTPEGRAKNRRVELVRVRD
jgi:outer membrane protein OmpA-like peptidoglycan-associated protein